jgi:hypothetical protein
MKARLAVALLACLLGALGSAQVGEGEKASPGAKVSVVQLTAMARLGEGVFPWWMHPGTTVYLRVTVPEETIVELNNAESPTEVFEDDAGTDFFADDEWGAPSIVPVIDEERHSMDVPIASGCPPAKGASRVTIRGALAVVLAAETASAAEKNAPLEADSTFNVGPYGVKVLSAEGTVGGTAAVELEITGDVTRLLFVRYLDGAGESLESHAFARSTWGPAGAPTNLRQSWTLPKWPAAVTLELTYCTKTKQIVVPYNVTVGLGMQNLAADEKAPQADTPAE